MVVYEVVAYERWSLTRSGHYERVDCIRLLQSIIIYFSVGLSIMVFKIGSNLDFAEEILMCDHSELFNIQALTNLS